MLIQKCNKIAITLIKDSRSDLIIIHFLLLKYVTNILYTLHETCIGIVATSGSPSVVPNTPCDLL